VLLLEQALMKTTKRNTGAMMNFEFKLDKCFFVIRDLEIGREEEAIDRAAQWIVDCKEKGKELGKTYSFFIDDFPAID
jgi:hypothetical protein